MAWYKVLYVQFKNIWEEFLSEYIFPSVNQGNF